MPGLTDKVAIITGASSGIGAAALFLASDASSFMTGTAMLVDGGVSICKT